jgi:hypothetical protein
LALTPHRREKARRRSAASRPARCTEAILLAHGFTIEQMVELVRAGLALATVDRMVADGRMMEIARVRITEAGRRALT